MQTKVGHVCLSVALVLLSSVAVAQQSQPSQQPRPYDQTGHDLEQVQRDYYAIPYAMQLTVLTDALKSVGKIEGSATQQSMADAATFDVSLTGMTTGKTSDIEKQHLTDFVTIPGLGQEVVHLSASEPAKGEKYGSVRAKWGPPERQPPANASSITMRDLFTDLSDAVGEENDRYGAYSVTLRYQGQSVNYKAIYLFSGTNPMHHQIVDLYLVGPRYSENPNAYRPSRLLSSSWRDIPALHDWLLAHTITDANCTQMNNLCCLSGHCAMRRSDFDRRMSQPTRDSTGPYSPSLAVPLTTRP